jgi:hypothetical protein
MKVSDTAANQFIVRASGGVWLGTTSAPSFPAGSFIATGTGAYLSAGGTWTNASDRNLKEDFVLVDGANLLARPNAAPISTWKYKTEDRSVRHLGPMAQDFYSAFGVGADDKRITTVDEGGVALAAIQALCRLSLEKDQEIQELRKELKELRALAARWAELEQARRQLFENTPSASKGGGSSNSREVVGTAATVHSARNRRRAARTAVARVPTRRAAPRKA